MNKELAILQLADYKEYFENGRSSCYLIINEASDRTGELYDMDELSVGDQSV